MHSRGLFFCLCGGWERRREHYNLSTKALVQIKICDKVERMGSKDFCLMSYTYTSTTITYIPNAY